MDGHSRRARRVLGVRALVLSSVVACAMSPSPALAWTSKWGGPLFETIHQDAIDNVLKTEIGDADRDSLKKQQELVDDSQYQDPANSYRHAMTGIANASETRPVEEPKYIAQAEQLIANNLNDAIGKRKSGSAKDAMEPLGQAIHPMEDATSPAHEGFQPWTYDESWLAKAHHIQQERIYPDGPYRTRLEAAVRWAYDIYMGTVAMPEHFFDSNGTLQLPPGYLK